MQRRVGEWMDGCYGWMDGWIKNLFKYCKSSIKPPGALRGGA